MIDEEKVVNEPSETVNTPVVEETAEVVETPKEEPKGKKKRKKSKVQNIIEWVITGIFAVIFVIAGIGQIDGFINAKKHYGEKLRFGFGSFIVQTNSMKEYKKGYAIITHLDDSDTVYERWLNGKTIDVTFMGINNGMYSNDIPVGIEGLEGLAKPAYPEKAVPITHRVRHIIKYEDKEKGEGKYEFFVTGTNTNGEYSKESQFQAFSEKELLGVVKYGSPVLGFGFRAVSSPIGLLVFLLIPALYLIITSSWDILKALKTSEENPEPNGVDKESKKLTSLDKLSDADRKRLKEEMLEEMMKGKGDKNEKN